MNLKKYLKQQAQKDAENMLTESDREFCMQLAQSVQKPKPERKRFNLKAISSVAVVCLLALVLGITLPLTLNKQPVVDVVHYKEEDIAQTECTIEDVNNNSAYFKIEEAENTAFRYRLYYDSVTGDKLYYSIGVTAEISAFTLKIVVNENYNYNFNTFGELSHKQLSQYNIEYNMRSVDGVMSTQLIYKGSIKVESETVYIDYTQEIDIGDEAFFGDIQSVLKLKN